MSLCDERDAHAWIIVFEDSSDAHAHVNEKRTQVGCYTNDDDDDEFFGWAIIKITNQKVN